MFIIKFCSSSLSWAAASPSFIVAAPPKINGIESHPELALDFSHPFFILVAFLKALIPFSVPFLPQLKSWAPLVSNPGPNNVSPAPNANLPGSPSLVPSYIVLTPLPTKAPPTPILVAP